MKIEVDVSGHDLFSKNYSICVVAEKYVRGFKFNESLVNDIIKNWKENRYSIKYSKKSSGKFKVKLYLIIIKTILTKILRETKEIEFDVHLCRDFKGHENTIIQSVKSLFEKESKKINSLICDTLPENSFAHHYAKSMFNDKLNCYKIYEKITLEEFEKKLIPMGL